MQPSPSSPTLGKLDPPIPAPDFHLRDRQGNEVALSDYRGKTVVVNFWASWCAVCRSEKPSLEALQEEYPHSEVQVLAVASDRDWAPVRRAIMGFDVTSADDVLRRPEVFGVRDPSLLAATGNQVVVSRVESGRPASKAGLHRLDRIVSVNDLPIESPADFDRVLRESGDVLNLVLARPGTTRSVVLEDESPLYVLLDPPNDDGNLGAIAKSYGITAVPESFVIDEAGMIRHYFINKRNWLGDVAQLCMRNLIEG
jgi:thiol-disulfide isomerase/thioredoxin